MDRHTLSSRLARIGDELPRLTNTINAMAANTGTYGKNYEELSLDAARRAERIACSLRNLIYAADLVPKPVLMEAAAQVHGISIKHTPDCVEITLPGLMPKRTKRINTTFLTDPLYASLESYTRQHFLMTDDSGLFCDAYHTTEFGERDCTILAVMEKSRFPGWLKEREDREKSISDF